MKPKFRRSSVFKLVAFLLLSLVQSVLAGKVVYEDKFTNLDPSWGASSEILGVKDGKLTLKPALNTTQSLLNQANFFDDADISVDVAMTVGDTNEPGGLDVPGGLIFLGEGLRQFLLLVHRWHRFFQD